MSTWICDTCGGAINVVEDGWVEWLVQTNQKAARDIRLVHIRPASPKPSGCQYQKNDYSREEVIHDSALTCFMGEDGLMTFMLLLHDKQLPIEQVIEMIKRVHITGYDQARMYFKQAIQEQVFEPNTPPNFYSTSEIQATLNFIKSQ